MRRRMDVWTYFQQKETEFRDRCGAVPDDAVFEEEPGSNGQRGKLFAQLLLGEDAYLQVYESAVVRNGAIHREVYSYALIVDGAHAHGWERDPLHTDAVVHEHTGSERVRQPSEPVSFKAVVEAAWDILTERELAPWEEENRP